MSSYLTIRPSFEPWSNFFSSAYDPVKGCDCVTIASALAKIGSASVLCMELHQGQGNLGRQLSYGMISHRWTCLIYLYNWKINESFSGRHCRHGDAMVFWSGSGESKMFWKKMKTNSSYRILDVPCPSQRVPLSLQRVPHWQWSEIADRSRRR